MTSQVCCSMAKIALKMFVIFVDFSTSTTHFKLQKNSIKEIKYINFEVMQ